MSSPHLSSPAPSRLSPNLPGYGRWRSRAFAQILAPSRDWRDWLFVPLLAQFLLVNFVAYPEYGQALYRWGTFQLPTNAIFPFTWGAALAAVILAGIWFRWRYREDGVRCAVYAVALAFAGTSAFEILYQNVGAGLGIGNTAVEGQVINLSAIAFGASSLRYWRASRVSLGLLALYLAGWLVWLSLGYPQITATSATAQWHAYVLNVGLKLGSFALFGSFVAFAPPAGRNHGAAPRASPPELRDRPE
jgi:hypothetical protein